MCLPSQRPCGQGIPTSTHRRVASTNCSCVSGGKVRGLPSIRRLGWKGPEHQRLFGVMLQQSGAAQIVVLRSIRDRPADLRARQDLVVAVLPPHRQRSQVPAAGAGNAGGVGVGLLVTAHALQRRDALAFRAPDHVGEMAMTIVPLLRVVRRRMAVDAARMRQDRVDLAPGRQPLHPRRARISFRRPFGTRGSLCARHSARGPREQEGHGSESPAMPQSLQDTRLHVWTRACDNRARCV